MDDALHRRFLESGSKEDLQLLMQKHYGLIHAHIAKIVNNYHDADEITNATFLKAYNERETIKNPVKPIFLEFRRNGIFIVDVLRTYRP